VTIASDKIEKLFIEFDGRQIEVHTDIPAARDLFEGTFRAMLVPRLTAPVGRIKFLKTSHGYAIHGSEKWNSRRRPLTAFIDYLRHDVVRQFIKARPDLLWIHAAAVERDGAALLIVGPSGQGKSTLSTHLCEAGWRLLSDDVAPIRMDTDEVLPFPQSAFRRRHPGREFLPNETGFLSKEEVPLPDAALRLNPAPIKALVFPVFRYDAPPQLTLLSEGEGALELLRSCSSFAEHRETAVTRIARLARSIPMYRLSYGAGVGAAAVLNATEWKANPDPASSPLGVDLPSPKTA
jgi:hypothetical protein